MKDNTKEDALIMLLVLILSVPSFILKAYILSSIWGWFIVPLGVVQISVSHALGISVFWSILTFSYKKSDDKESIDYLKTLFSNTAGILMGWGIAYIAYLIK